MKKKYLGILVLPLFLAVIGCGDPVPVKEMTAAKVQITSASEVKADKYAPSEYKDAQNSLYESQQFAKDDKMDDAKESAIKAESKAKLAYDKSLPPLSKEVLAIANSSLIAADEAFATEMASGEFMDAKNSYLSAESAYNKKDYKTAYIMGVQADEKAKNAKNIAISQKGVFNEKMNNVKYTLTEAEKYNASKVAPESVKNANDNLKDAEGFYANDKLKACNDRIVLAQAAANEAFKVSAKKAADAKIAEADKAVSAAEKSKKAKAAAEELNGAKEMLSTAKNQYQGEQFPEAIASAEEAMKLASFINSGKAGAIEETSDGYEIYIVKYKKNGTDYLRRIAKKFYGDESKWKVIYEANKDKIKNPDVIYGGWKFKIPKIDGMKSIKEVQAEENE